MYVLSTDGQVQDFRFPQSNEGGVSIQLSANTVKLNSRNGELYLVAGSKKRTFLEIVLPILIEMERILNV